MLLRDNFIHADLHPGNILVTLDAPAPGSLAAAASRLLHVPLRVPRLVLLDVGMTAALTDADQANLVAFFKVCELSICLLGGGGAAAGAALCVRACVCVRECRGLRRRILPHPHPAGHNRKTQTSTHPTTPPRAEPD
jgi:hypothetical protein